MSHELRTPLNSLLLLAEQLRQNPERNLSPRQLDMIKVVHDSGSDLLHLINDILDLSKIESGSATLDIEDVPISELSNHVERTFRHVAESKGLEFKVDFAPELPPTVRTDEQRLKQVLKNLLSNAIKFTAKGRVTLSASVATSGWSADHQMLNRAQLVIAFTVSDTGIGIPESKQKLIFEAFQQADASTSRRYGGTGLGLAISREIAYLLGGELRAQSEVGVGSLFTFYLPQQRDSGQPRIERGERFDANMPIQPRAEVHSVPITRAYNATIADDRAFITPNDTLLLIVEDDPVFARFLSDMAHERGFKTLVTSSGEEALALARKYHPDAVTLDLILPDLDGWVVADRMKTQAETRDIPVHVISIHDRPKAEAQHGAASYSAKPADVDTLARIFANVTHNFPRPIHALLVVTSDPAKREAVMAALKREDIELNVVSNASEAMAAIRSRQYQGIVLDFDLDDMDGVALVQDIRRDPACEDIPLIVYTFRTIEPETKDQLTQMHAVVLMESDFSLESLGQDVAQFLQRVQSELPQDKRANAHDLSSEMSLQDKQVLLVDDDVRNLFALTGMLENNGMKVIAVESGQEAIDRLQDTPGIDVVLMDIMMPGMDGYETMKKIRSEPRFKDLPIIALTAKAMKGDREKCLEAGATDYASKPVDSAQLLSQLRQRLLH
jgi:CheY-like chemotaxis protein